MLTKSDLKLIKQVIQEVAVTKEEAKPLVTKSDLKEALKPYVTKSDLKEALDEQWEAIKEAIGHLPTKEEFYSKMDELLKEVKASREEQIVISGYKDQIENHEKRIDKLEKVLVP